jgi:hypothetical protein
MTTWSIPDPLETGAVLRDPASARITVTRLPDGRRRRVIEHAPLPGVRAPMMVWYLRNVDRTDLAWRGHRCLAYRYWHPRDHIHFRILGKPGPGCRFHIVEAFQANPRYLMDMVFDVPELDETGFRMEVRRLGTVVVGVREDFRDSPQGMLYTVTVTEGTTAPVLGALVNPLQLRFAKERLDAWHRHNVEEVGNLPVFLPELYDAYGRG